MACINHVLLELLVLIVNHSSIIFSFQIYAIRILINSVLCIEAVASNL
jgi:hypothetical protein